MRLSELRRLLDEIEAQQNRDGMEPDPLIMFYIDPTAGGVPRELMVEYQDMVVRPSVKDGDPVVRHMRNGTTKGYSIPLLTPTALGLIQWLKNL